jgi:hypothetical protein
VAAACPELFPVPLHPTTTKLYPDLIMDLPAALKHTSRAACSDDTVSLQPNSDGFTHMARFGHPLAKESLADTIGFFCCKFRKTV